MWRRVKKRGFLETRWYARNPRIRDVHCFIFFPLQASDAFIDSVTIEKERERENTTHEQWQSICHEIERKLAPVEVFLQKSCCFHRDRDPKIILYSVCVFRALSTLNTKLVQLIRPASNGQRKTTNHLHHRIFFLTVYPCHSTCVRLVYLFLYFICMISQSFRTDGNTEKDVTCRSRWAVRCLRPRLWISRRS